MGIFSEPGQKLAQKAMDDPGSVRSQIPKMKELVEQGGAGRVNGTLALGMVAIEYPEDVEDMRPRLISLLQDDDWQVRTNAAIAIYGLALEYPESMTLAINPLTDQLNSQQKDLRMAAVRALGAIGDEQAITSLKEHIESESDNEIKGEIYDAIDNSGSGQAEMGRIKSQTQTINPQQQNTPGASSEDNSGLITNCPSCGHSLNNLPGIPRNCPGCGLEIRSIL